jgi:hypothetical protein
VCALFDALNSGRMTLQDAEASATDALRTRIPKVENITERTIMIDVVSGIEEPGEALLLQS